MYSFVCTHLNKLNALYVSSRRKAMKTASRNQAPRPHLPSPSQDTGRFPTWNLRTKSGGFLCVCVCVLLFFYLQKRHIFSENISFSLAFWLVFRPPPLLSDGGNRALPPASSARWRGSGSHSNELFLQASFGSLFLYPLARGTNSKQQPNPGASKIQRNLADMTVRGSP